METGLTDMTASNRILGTILECSIWLEEETAKLYLKLSSRVEHKNTAQLLKIIGLQSRSHAEMLNWILETILEKRKLRETDCLKITGEVGEINVSIIRAIEEKDTITRKDLCNIIRKLEFIENGIGEETYSRILLPLLKTTMKQTYPANPALGIAEEIVETIINEEKLHEKLVTLISTINECDARANPSS